MIKMFIMKSRPVITSYQQNSTTEVQSVYGRGLGTGGGRGVGAFRLDPFLSLALSF